MQKIYLTLALLLLSACNPFSSTTENVKDVHASFQTPPSKDGKDHMDDPAIYINKKNPEKSFILGTDKSHHGGGIHLYDLEGHEIGFARDGRMNNVDVRYNFPLKGKRIDIAVASHRDKKRMAVYEIDAETQSLKNITDPSFTFSFKPYGCCLYHNPQTDKFYFFATSTSGLVEQVELIATDEGLVSGKRVRAFNVGSKSEGCVCDDENGTLYLGEEDVALWKYDAEPSGGDVRVRIDNVGEHLKADIEGITLYKAELNKGYIIVSSQGNSTYVIYSLTPPHNYVGTFRIVGKGDIEGTEETDGIAATSFALPPHYPKGLFVAHDNRSSKAKAGKPGGSDFKLVSWESIKKVLDLVE